MKNIHEAFRVREKILSENNTGSMVARRLLWLLGKVDLSNIRQVFDIGSWHLGQSIEFSNIFEYAQINAFEPVPDSYHYCMQRLRQLEEQRGNRIRVHNLALSDQKGEIPFYPINTAATQKFDAGFSSMFKLNEQLSDVEVQSEIKVQADRLDNWCNANCIDYIDIMWVDTQGAEFLVFQGAKTILKNTKIIFTEVGLKPYYEGHTLKADIDVFLSDLGFQELTNSFEMNIKDYEANTIYIRQ